MGEWTENVSVGGMPQKIATAFGKLNELVGAEYEFIAYLGSQLVNGTNHAVLATQTVLTGRDTKNVVLVIFNEKGEDVTLVNIERVIEGGGALGGIEVDAKTELTQEMKDLFNAALEGFVGATFEPFALLATQVTTGTNYFFAAKTAPVVPNPSKRVVIVTVNSLAHTTQIANLLANKNSAPLGYAFNW